MRYKKIMVCNECDEEDESMTAYCLKHGRSFHRIVEMRNENHKKH